MYALRKVENEQHCEAIFSVVLDRGPHCELFKQFKPRNERIESFTTSCTTKCIEIL